MNKGITRQTIIKVAVLPGIWPRARELFAGGFPHLAYLIANLFDMLRLLPAGHPYLNRGNFGRYGILDVLRAGTSELKPGWRNTDKFIAFFAVITGIIMLMVQFVLMIAALIIAPASAQAMPTTYGGVFRTAHPKEDIAFRMLDMVFGIPGLFGLEKGDSEPFHLALQAMLEFYSYGILFIGLFLLIYIVIVIVAETAQTGIPFGKRFNHAWAPLRLILFLGLLIPISHGINGAQYIVFLAAKGGSGVATNGWKMFHDKMADSYLGDPETLVAIPPTPDLSGIPAFIMLAKTCQIAQGHQQQKDIQAWVIIGNESELLGERTFQDLTGDARGRGIKVRFGEKNPAFTNMPGNVAPTCGEMFFYTSDMAEPGAAEVQTAYYDMVKVLWKGGSSSGPRGGGDTYSTIRGIGNDLQTFARGFFEKHIEQSTNIRARQEYRATWGGQLDYFMDGKPYEVNGVTHPEKEDGGVIGRAVKKQIEEGDWSVDDEDTLLKKGWAGAAIWYNRIAQQNGALTTAVSNYPAPVLFPEIMMKVAQQKAAKEFFVTDEERFSLSMRDPKNEIVLDNKEKPLASLYNDVYQFWQTEHTRTDAGAANRQPTENIIVDTINLFFGTHGLFEMCRNADVHPLAQIASLGKGLTDSAVRGFATSAVLGVGSTFLSLVSPYLGKAGYTATSMMMTFAGLGLMLGFILFYIVPFLPFMYFFFAAGSWLKGLFEAIVGAPLWALGHLRIDGEGMAGEAARDGYFMLLEIFLRPILIIFGLLASLVIFGAMVKVLHDIFGEVLSALPAGEEGATACFSHSENNFSHARGAIDELFYTIVYAIVVYLIAMSSFKLIDAIPNSIMRWMGEEIAAFGDQSGDAAEGLIQRVAVGGAGIGERLEGGLGGVAGNLKDSFGGLAQMFTKK